MSALYTVILFDTVRVDFRTLWSLSFLFGAVACLYVVWMTA